MEQSSPASRRKRSPSWIIGLGDLSVLRKRADDAAANVPALMSTAERAARAVLSGEYRQRVAGSGEKFWQFREYVPTDRPQDIDWRQSAKGERVFIRQKEWQTSQTSLFYVQQDEGMFYHSRRDIPRKYDEAVTIALALSIVLSGQGEMVGLYGGAHRAGRSAKSVHIMGEDLARPDPARTPNMHDLQKHLPPRGRMILIGDFLGDPEQTAIMIDQMAARAQTGVMIQTLDPAERNLPFHGRVIFEETATHIDHHISEVASIRDSYRARIAEHEGRLRAMCKNHLWHFTIHESGADIGATLYDVWQFLNEAQRGAR